LIHIGDVLQALVTSLSLGLIVGSVCGGAVTQILEDGGV